MTQVVQLSKSIDPSLLVVDNPESEAGDSLPPCCIESVFKAMNPGGGRSVGPGRDPIQITHDYAHWTQGRFEFIDGKTFLELD